MKAIGWLVAMLGLGAICLITATGCSDDGCSLAMPICELSVELEHSQWEPGAYAFEIEVKGEVHRCTATLPDVGAETLECTGTGWIAGSMRPGGHTGPGGYTVPLWHSGFPTSLAFQGSPKNTRVRIFYEGQEVASKSFKPRYKVTEPNGEGCGDCRNATVGLAF